MTGGTFLGKRAAASADDPRSILTAPGATHIGRPSKNRNPTVSVGKAIHQPDAPIDGRICQLTGNQPKTVIWAPIIP